jgi:hypothetical protein
MADNFALDFSNQEKLETGPAVSTVTGERRIGLVELGLDPRQSLSGNETEGEEGSSPVTHRAGGIHKSQA